MVERKRLSLETKIARAADLIRRRQFTVNQATTNLEEATAAHAALLSEQDRLKKIEEIQLKAAADIAALTDGTTTPLPLHLRLR